MSATTTAAHYPQTTPAPPAGSGATRTRSLGRYLTPDSQEQREIVLLKRPDGSALLVDYQLGTLSDGRLIAHLAADEPVENAYILRGLYLADDTKGRCRAVTPEDFELTRDATAPSSDGDDPSDVGDLRDAAGHLYLIRELPTPGTMLQMRWTRSREPGRESGFDVVSYRDVLDALESYEPARTLTTQALTRRGGNPSTRRLQQELDRLAASPIVLNRGLREAVERQMRNGELSMSEIAQRCNRVKHDTRGNTSGETTWLARRIGQLPEGGQSEPTPWVHTEVLGLIARDGLGVSPHEVEI